MENPDVNEEYLFFNGLNGTTGTYDLPPMTKGELVKIIKGEDKPENLAELRWRYRQQTQAHLGVKAGIDSTRLDQAGWGVVFGPDVKPIVKEEALSELIELRRGQAGPYFKRYDLQTGESKTSFLLRNGAGPGEADPENVPYYLLLVGSPQSISFRFQYQLDVQYAVGRIHFDTAQEYANYAQSVVNAESGKVTLPRQASFFGVQNPDDNSTRLSAQHLVTPLADELRKAWPDWKIGKYQEKQATKSRLGRLLGGDLTPALLFTASHGMRFNRDDTRLLEHQGALLCQDWPGNIAWWGKGKIPPEHYFAGEDVSSEAQVLGLIAFFFACFGAGTPVYDDFSKRAFREPKPIAPYPFLSRLPNRLLGHPKGGALAVVGHIDRALGYSFLWNKTLVHTVTFQSALHRLLQGYPIGAAMEYLNERYAELATVLNDELLEGLKFGEAVNVDELTDTWSAHNDARNYVLLGDPAARLPIAGPEDTPTERPTISVAKLSETPASEPPGKANEASAQIPTPDAQGALDVPEHKVIAEQPAAPAALPSPVEILSYGAGQELTTLTVSTYAAAAVGNAQEKELKVRSRISLTGDVQTVLPAQMTAEDQPYLELHRAMVQEALEARLAYLELVARMGSDAPKA